MDGALFFIVVFIILLLVKLPVPIAVGTACIVGLLNADISTQLMITSSLKTLNSFTLLAVPFFILAGNFMTRGSIAAKLLAVAKEVMAREELKYCPHGRPICITLSKKQLEKQFKRT